MNRALDSPLIGTTTDEQGLGFTLDRARSRPHPTKVICDRLCRWHSLTIKHPRVNTTTVISGWKLCETDWAAYQQHQESNMWQALQMTSLNYQTPQSKHNKCYLRLKTLWNRLGCISITPRQESMFNQDDEPSRLLMVIQSRTSSILRSLINSSSKDVNIRIGKA